MSYHTPCRLYIFSNPFTHFKLRSLTSNHRPSLLPLTSCSVSTLDTTSLRTNSVSFEPPLRSPSLTITSLKLMGTTCQFSKRFIPHPSLSPTSTTSHLSFSSLSTFLSCLSAVSYLWSRVLDLSKMALLHRHQSLDGSPKPSTLTSSVSSCIPFLPKSLFRSLTNVNSPLPWTVPSFSGRRLPDSGSRHCLRRPF